MHRRGRALECLDATGTAAATVSEEIAARAGRVLPCRGEEVRGVLARGSADGLRDVLSLLPLRLLVIGPRDVQET